MEMSRRRIYVDERPSKRSFDIAMFTAGYLVVAVIVCILWYSVLPLSWDLLLWVFIVPALIGFGLSWIAKKIEKIEETW